MCWGKKCCRKKITIAFPPTSCLPYLIFQSMYLPFLEAESHQRERFFCVCVFGFFFLVKFLVCAKLQHNQEECALIIARCQVQHTVSSEVLHTKQNPETETVPPLQKSQVQLYVDVWADFPSFDHQLSPKFPAASMIFPLWFIFLGNRKPCNHKMDITQV